MIQKSFRVKSCLYNQTHRKWPEGAITKSYLEFFKVFVNVTSSVHFT